MRGIGNIRVLILGDGSGWWAQGLEIDYGAEGKTIEEAEMHFEQGLQETFRLNRERFGHIKHLFQRAIPREFWEKLASGVSLRETKASTEIFPFEGFEFLSGIE